MGIGFLESVLVHYCISLFYSEILATPWTYFIVKSLQLRGRRQIAEPHKYCLVRVIVSFGVYFLYLFCFSQVGILVKFPTTGIRA